MTLLQQLQELAVAPEASQWAHCQYNHPIHSSKRVEVDLAHPRADDMATINRDLNLKFQMKVWEWNDPTFTTYPKYCPRQDIVSWSIDNYGIWEPYETAIVLDLLSEEPTGSVLDIGAHIGWYSVLASLKGYETFAVESDAANIRLMQHNNALNDIEIQTVHGYVDEHAPMIKDSGFHFVKCDIEGNEQWAYRMLFEPFARHEIKYALFEISPSFNDSYPDLIESICGDDYRMFQVPHKGWPKVDMFRDDPLETLKQYCEIPAEGRREYIAGLEQENMLFIRNES